MNYAVITGDIVGSAKLSTQERARLLHVLKEILNSVPTPDKQKEAIPFEIYRGDSFQGIISTPEKALFFSLIIRAGLRSLSASTHLAQLWDARIAIGIGKIESRMAHITESDGEAFQLSGRTLDGMKNNKERLKIISSNDAFNDEMEVSTRLCDTLIQQWTRPQSEAIYPFLLHNKTQEETGRIIGVSQRVVSKRLDAANMDAILPFIKRFENLTKQLP